MLKRLVLITTLIVLSSAAHSKVRKEQLPYINYVNIPVQTADASWHVGGQYRLPREPQEAKFPAVVVIHNSAGVDSTGRFYIKKLNKAGIATLELDLWAARGLSGGSADRPESPQETLPDAIAALHFLAQQEEIDPAKIGIMGYSWGGVLAMLSATENYMSLTGAPLRFSAHVAHYPVCFLYNNIPGFEFNNLTGAPVLIQTAEYDDYDLPQTCPAMVSNLSEQDKQYVTAIEFEDVYHAWDRLEPTWIVQDPIAHLGQGGEVRLIPNKKVARKSRKNVVEFFKSAFGLND